MCDSLRERERYFRKEKPAKEIDQHGVRESFCSFCDYLDNFSSNFSHEDLYNFLCDCFSWLNTFTKAKPVPYVLIFDSSFPKNLVDIYMFTEITLPEEEKMLKILSYLTSKTAKVLDPIFLQRDFLNRLFASLNNQSLQVVAAGETIASNILSFDNGFEALYETQIVNRFENVLIHSGDFEVKSMACYFLETCIKHIKDRDELDFIIQQFVKQLELPKENKRPLIHALRIILDHIKNNPEHLINFANMGIIELCIQFIEDPDNERQYIMDYSLKIIGMYVQNNEEIERIVSLGIIDILLNMRGFFNLNELYKVDEDTFGFVCDILKGLIQQSDPFIQQCLDQSNFIQKLTSMMISGPLCFQINCFQIFEEIVNCKIDNWLAFYFNNGGLNCLMNLLNSEITEKILSIFIKICEYNNNFINSLLESGVDEKINDLIVATDNQKISDLCQILFDLFNEKNNP